MKKPKNIAHANSDIPDKQEVDEIINALRKKEWLGSPDQYISSFEEAPEKIHKAIGLSWPNPGATSAITAVKKIYKYDGGAEFVSIRDGVFFELCSDSILKDERENLQNILQQWLRTVPESIFTTANIVLGKNSERFSWNKNIEKVLRHLLAKKKDAEFEIYGPEFYNPSFYFKISCYDKIVIKMTWPSAGIWQFGIESFVGWITEVVQAIPAFSWARCGPGLLQQNMIDTNASDELLQQNPGWEIPRSYKDIKTDKCPTPTWLNYLSTALIDELGGKSALMNNLDAEISVRDVNNGLLLRTAPELVVNTTGTNMALPSVTRAIRQVIDFDVTYDLKQHFKEKQTAEKWLKRYL